MVRKGTDIRRLISRRLQQWKDSIFDELVTDSERCARRLPCSKFRNEKGHCVKVFTRLMLQGQVRSAVRFVTNRLNSGGVLALDASIGVPGKSVMDILCEKHPEPGFHDGPAFMPCDTLPDLDITADYVERLARQIQWFASPGGSTALQ